jgi:peptidoglycan hydrolase CwlO-like protein
MSNRVEELESQVAELKAAVDGLTEELVETRERLRQLEAAEGVERTRAPERRGAESGPSPGADGSATPTDSAADADAETETEAAATPDTGSGAESEADDDGSDSDGNDIIVA